MFFGTLLTYAVGELSLGMVMNICFNLSPAPFLITNFFSVGTDRQNSLQGFYLIQSFLQT